MVELLLQEIQGNPATSLEYTLPITDAHEVLGEGFTLDKNKQPLEQ